MNVALTAVQLAIDGEVLASGEAYRQHLEAAVADAVAAAGAADAHVVVVPEMAGHFALLALAPSAARRARTLGSALAAIAVRRPIELIRGLAVARVLDPRQAVLAALAPDGERFWRAVFGPLARLHRCYLVAGSHLRLVANGDLLNASFAFGPDGRLLGTTCKVNLVPGMEDRSPQLVSPRLRAAGGSTDPALHLGLTRGDALRVPIVETSFGTLATLISYDAFHEPHTLEERFTSMTEALHARGGVTVVANPAANPWRWRGTWPPPRFAGLVREPNVRTRAQQWEHEGPPASLAAIPFTRWLVTAQLVGTVLDVELDGISEILERRDGELRVLARAPRPDAAGPVTATVAVP